MPEQRLTPPEMTLEEWILTDAVRVIGAMDWLRRHPETFATICVLDSLETTDAALQRAVAL